MRGRGEDADASEGLDASRLSRVLPFAVILSSSGFQGCSPFKSTMRMRTMR